MIIDDADFSHTTSVADAARVGPRRLWVGLDEGSSLPTFDGGEAAVPLPVR